MSESTTEAADKGTEGNADQQGTAMEPDWKAEAEKWKGLARKHEDQWKANADKVTEFDRLVEASKSDQQRLEERATKAEGSASTLAEENLKLKVALAKGVHPDLIERLRGSTQEELEKDADFLNEKFAEANKTSTPDLRSAVGQRRVTTEQNPDDWLRQMAGRGR